MYFHQKLRRTVYILLLPLGSLPAQTTAASAAEAISYPKALEKAIAADPRFQLNASRAEAAEGKVDQAGLRPNPVISTEVENFLGTGPLNGVEGLEVTLGVRQLVETAGKRHKRTALARAERELVDWEKETLLAQTEADVRSAFVDVLISQQILELRREQLDLAERSAQETDQLVEAARSPRVEQTRAALAVSQQRFALRQAEREYATAKSVLASLWGDTSAGDFSVVGELRIEDATPELSELAAALVNTAALSRFSAEEQVRKAALDLERARATPDVEVFAGSRYFNEDGGHAGFLLGVDVPWPLFNRNQGNIRAARAELSAVRQQREATRRQLLIALNDAYQQLIGAAYEAAIIQAELLPAARATLRDMEEGYERGKFQQLAVLESRSTLFDIRESYLEALRQYAVAQADIEALTRPATR